MPRKMDATPQGRMSAYAYFMQACRGEHRRKYPNENVMFDTFTTKCSQRWQTMTKDEKSRFVDMAKKDYQRFVLEQSLLLGGKTVKGSRKKPCRDPRKPKRAMSAYLIFCEDERKVIRKEREDYQMKDVSVELGRRWNLMTPEQKKPFVLQSEEQKLLYRKEMAAYKQLIKQEREQVAKKKHTVASTEKEEDTEDDEIEDEEDDEDEEEEEDEEVDEEEVSD